MSKLRRLLRQARRSLVRWLVLDALFLGDDVQEDACSRS